MAFIAHVVRSATSPSTSPYGIGGDSSKIWHSDISSDLIYELNTSDFSVVRSAASPATFPYGIGGDANTIWHCDPGVDLVYELSTTDFSVVRSAASPYSGPYGIGGSSSKIWHCDSDSNLIYELSTSDFSVARSAASPYIAPRGIGGDSSVIWHCDSTTNSIYELSTSDFSVIKSADSPASSPYGVGGSSSKIWLCDNGTDLVYELEFVETDEATYYFNARGAAVWTDPDNIVDNNLATFGYTNVYGIAQLLNGNSCPGTDLGPITKVELRLYGYGDGDDRIDVAPVYAAGDGATRQITPGTSAGWSSWKDITNDTNAPDWSSWSHIQTIDCKLTKVNVAKGNTTYCAKVEIRVTHVSEEEPPPPPEHIPRHSGAVGVLMF